MAGVCFKMVCSWDGHVQSFPAQASGGKKEEVIPAIQKRVGARPTKVGRKKVTSCKVDDEVFHVGDSAYALAEGQTYEVLSQSWVHGISPVSCSRDADVHDAVLYELPHNTAAGLLKMPSATSPLPADCLCYDCACTGSSASVAWPLK